jgi:hypothetical protein
MFQIITSWSGTPRLEELFLTGGMSESALKVRLYEENLNARVMG